MFLCVLSFAIGTFYAELGSHLLRIYVHYFVKFVGNLTICQSYQIASELDGNSRRDKII
jgi:hypothetical protein